MLIPCGKNHLHFLETVLLVGKKSLEKCSSDSTIKVMHLSSVNGSPVTFDTGGLPSTHRHALLRPLSLHYTQYMVHTTITVEKTCFHKAIHKHRD